MRTCCGLKHPRPRFISAQLFIYDFFDVAFLFYFGSARRPLQHGFRTIAREGEPMEGSLREQ